MKKKIRPTKNDHATKSPNERKRYRELLDVSEKTINETVPYRQEEKDDEDLSINETIAETSRNEEYKKLKKIDTTDEEKLRVKPYESLSTKFNKYIKDIIIGIILFGVVGVSVMVVWDHHKDIATIFANVNSISEDIDDLSKKYDNINDDKIETVQITTEIKKDLEFIKSRLNKIEN